MDQLLANRDAATGVDLVELRLDGVRDAGVRRALEGRSVPAIVTCRPEWEGGRHRGPEAARMELLNEAIDAGADYVDAEFRADRAALRSRARVVLSFHDLTGMPRQLGDTVAAMRAAGCGVVKIAVAVSRLADCVALRDATPSAGTRQVVIGMGPAGTLTRVCPWLFGSCWTYAGSAAPGQLPARALREQYRFGETSPATRLFGVVGEWRGALALAAAHNVEFRARGIDAMSIPLAAADARDLECAVRAFSIAGLSEAVPGAERAAPATQAARDVDRWMAA
jgi:3-dehydroquinate dehydratase/shikimate dehydrogenase